MISYFYLRVLRKTKVLAFQQRRIMYPPIQNQYRTNCTTIMNLKNRYIATNSVFSNKKKKKYNIRSLNTERNSNLIFYTSK